MIERIEIVGKQLTITEDMKKYVEKKIGKLDKLMAKNARESVHAEVILHEEKTGANKFMCEVVLHMPHETIAVKESTINIFAAIDIVEKKLINRLKKSHDKAVDHKSDRKGILRKFRAKADKEFRARQN